MEKHRINMYPSVAQLSTSLIGGMERLSRLVMDFPYRSEVRMIKAMLSILLVAVLTTGLGLAQFDRQANLCGSTYIVQDGDSLAKIAVRCNVSLNSLLVANPQLANPNVIYTGMTIFIPGGGAILQPIPTLTPGVITSTSTAGVPVTGSLVYAVQTGDSLSRIASVHGMSEENLIAANPGIDRYTILYPGINLVIPGSANRPLVGISPTTGVMGTTITLVASGFTANQAVRIGFGPQLGGIQQLDLKTAAADGTLILRYVLPASANRDEGYIFVVQKADDPTVHVVSNVFTLYGTGISSAGVPVTGLPSSQTSSGTRGSLVSISPIVAGAGDRITVSAAGFPPNSHVDIRIGKEDQEYSGVIDATVDAFGRVSASLPVPAAAKFGETWVVTVETTDRLNATTAVSGPITINR
jgi:LysM repeat protein